MYFYPSYFAPETSKTFNIYYLRFDREKFKLMKGEENVQMPGIDILYQNQRHIFFSSSFDIILRDGIVV